MCVLTFTSVTEFSFIDSETRRPRQRGIEFNLNTFMCDNEINDHHAV